MLQHESANLPAIAGLTRAHLAAGDLAGAKKALARAPADKAGDKLIAAARAAASSCSCVAAGLGILAKGLIGAALPALALLAWLASRRRWRSIGMLAWPPGPRDTDGVWGKYWYDAVWKSTSFQPYRPKNESVPPHLGELLEQAEALVAHLLVVAVQKGLIDDDAIRDTVTPDAIETLWASMAADAEIAPAQKRVLLLVSRYDVYLLLDKILASLRGP